MNTEPLDTDTAGIIQNMTTPGSAMKMNGRCAQRCSHHPANQQQNALHIMTATELSGACQRPAPLSRAQDFCSAWKQNQKIQSTKCRICPPPSTQFWLPGVSDNGRGMKGSGTVRRGGLVSKLRMSFVFSAGDQEDRRQSETEKREKQKALSKL